MRHPSILHSGLLLHNDMECLYINTRPYAQHGHAVGCGVAQLNILIKFIILCRYLFAAATQDPLTKTISSML